MNTIAASTVIFLELFMIQLRLSIIRICDVF
jgi:hypothetical protein